MTGQLATVAGLALALTLGSAVSVRADPDGDATAYESAITAALERYAERDWAAARAAFERAHAFRPGARALRGVALSAYYEGDYVAAAGAFEQALGEQRHPLSPEQRAEAGDLLARVYDRVGQLRVKARPEGAAIRFAGRSIENDERVLLAPGRYPLEVTLPGYKPRAQHIEITAGQQQSLYVELPPEPVAPSPLPPVEAPPPALEVRRPSAPPTPETHSAVWIAAGATLAAGASAAVFAFLAEDELQSIQHDCRRAAQCDAMTRAELWADSPIETYETLINVSLAAAAVGAATTAALFLLSPQTQPRESAQVRLRAARAGLLLATTF